MYKREDFKIDHYVEYDGNRWFAVIKNTDNYLFKSKMWQDYPVVKDWEETTLKYGLTNANNKVYFSSREKLEKCLDTYLKNQIRKGQEMDLNERLIQVRKDKEAIEQEEKKLLAEMEHKWVHGDIFHNCVGTQIYLEPYNGPIVVSLSHKKSGGTPDVQLKGDDVKFLFNIKDALSDRGII